MAKKQEVNDSYTLLKRIYIGAALAFLVIGTAFTAIGIWSTARFKACQQTVVCDNDIIPPVTFVAMGLMSVVVCRMFVSFYRHLSTPEEAYVPFRGLGVMLLGSGLTYLTLCLQQRFDGADLEYYQWLAQRGTGRFVVDLALSTLAITIGLWTTYHYRRPV